MLCIAVTLLSVVALVPRGNKVVVRNRLMMSTKEIVKASTSSDKFRPKEGTSATTLVNDPVYSFGKNQTPKKLANTKQVLGGKGANLADMAKIGLSVPPGFTITTEVCDAYLKGDLKLPKGTWDEVLKALKVVENEMGRTFGGKSKPLLVSVRSGAAVSMPGMMDTILNLGLNDETVKALAKDHGERFAYDSYRRFINMYGTVVLNIPHHYFEDILHAIKTKNNVKNDSDLTPAQLQQCIDGYKKVYADLKHPFPNDVYTQLYSAIDAVFGSWNSDRAIKYRQAEGITGLLGTAVNIQAMCFGNMGDTSGTGVLFTRNPSTGENKLYGEYLMNAQGEDVVAGIRTPNPISSLEEQLPDAYKELLQNIEILEKYYHDMQDIEFTIQEGRLFMLQTRTGKRVGNAAVNIAMDLVNEGICSVDEAIMTVKPEHLNQLLHAQFVNIKDKSYTENVVAKGLPASPGAAVGMIVFSPEVAEEKFAEGIKCILVRDDTSPEDVGGMYASEGVLTSRGGMTSHAAVVARGWGKPCICGCDDLKIDYEKKTVTFYSKESNKNIVANEGDWISLNGDTGEVILDKLPLKPPSLESSTATKVFMEWVDKKRNIKVLANADTPADAAEARRNGAQGIGLTRTEHMFFAEDRIRVVRRMILSKDKKHRQAALDDLLPYQRNDFEGILEAMDCLPVTVRLLDPPLHEFLPKAEQVDSAFAAEVGMSVEECKHTIERMEEVNPMLGLRGCRLGVVLPELVEMQVRALVEASLNNKYKKGLNPVPEIMIPLVGSVEEFKHQQRLIQNTIEKVTKEHKQNAIRVKIGTMIEVPRAALIASEIVMAGAEFFSYGTNDLTQLTYGFSRDDIGSYLPTYIKQGIVQEDPFEVIDENGVGKLILMSAQSGRAVAANNNVLFKAGVCGEHGGDPKSVRFFVKAGMNYVSCSPFRVPVARLAAAQAVIEEERKGMGITAPINREKWEYRVVESDDGDDEMDEGDGDKNEKKPVYIRTFSPKRAEDVKGPREKTTKIKSEK